VTAERYWSLSIELPRRHLEALSARLLELGFPSFEERPAPHGLAVIVYAPDPGLLESVRQALLRARASGELPAGELGFRLAEVAPGWALEWTKHLGPVALTSTLTLYPHRPARAPAAGELYLEPAFAFGFGEHESTRLVARWLEAACRLRPGSSVLDVGCGTGVLALVASRSGAGSVLGIDVSEPAILAARSNAALNGVERGVAFERAGIDQVSGAFGHVVANIEAAVLCELAAGIAQRVAPGGELGLAGFMREQHEAVARRYAMEGLRLELRDCVDDWCLLVGKKDRQDAKSARSSEI
jgi:ribosomal protein L11 methyltransferase